MRLAAAILARMARACFARALASSCCACSIAGGWVFLAGPVSIKGNLSLHVETGDSTFPSACMWCHALTRKHSEVPKHKRYLLAVERAPCCRRASRERRLPC